MWAADQEKATKATTTGHKHEKPNETDSDSFYDDDDIKAIEAKYPGCTQARLTPAALQHFQNTNLSSSDSSSDN